MNKSGSVHSRFGGHAIRVVFTRPGEIGRVFVVNIRYQ